ncbi:MAG: DNA topoisomerase III [Lachnospiraceae bacterium]|nr:DNA topoisomerase III [Lachnospiraceae bacterium]
MMKSLIIAEKPSVGRDIAKVLKCNKKENGFMEGNTHIVTWALGHLVTLADPEAYDDKYKSWDIDHLPIIPEKPELIVIKQTSAQFRTVKAQIGRKDVSEIIIATDAGREGELVARWILEKAGNKKPVKRLWISSVTDKAILEGFKNLKDGKNYIPLYNSAKARAIADWVVGINATRALTAKHNAQLSCGRVQTPTIAIVNAKEEEIRSFRPKDYYTIKLNYKNTDFTLKNKDGSFRIFDKNYADGLLITLKGKEAEIKSIDKKRHSLKESGLYDLTLLQRDANRLFNFSAKETLNIMQSLYERHKVVTYPRTDSKYISQDIVPTIPERLKAIRFGGYKKFVGEIQKNGIKVSKSFVDDSKVSDHHAIIPTEEAANISDFTDKEMKIYDLIIKHFLAVFYAPYEYDEMTVTASCSGETFIAKGKNIISLGYKEIYGKELKEEDSESDLKDQLMPTFERSEKFTLQRLQMDTGKTKPPAYFTEGTLLAAMENPKAYIKSSDKEISKTLTETGGLGTVATRADIIDKLFSNFMLEKRRNSIFVTSKGKQLLSLAPKDLKTPDLTAKWELELNKIAENKLNKDVFLSEINEYTRKIIKEIKTSDGKFRHDNITGKKCPECGKFLLEVNGKKGKMLVCQDRECGYRKSISFNSNTRCPECHKKMTITGEGADRRYICSCGFKEKVDAFHEKRALEGNKMSKKDIDKYLNKLNKDEKPENSAIADALKGLKL